MFRESLVFLLRPKFDSKKKGVCLFVGSPPAKFPLFKNFFFFNIRKK